MTDAIQSIKSIFGMKLAKQSYKYEGKGVI